VIDHLSVGTTDYTSAVAFYRAALGPLGLALQRDTGVEADFGTEAHWCFIVYPLEKDEQPVAPRMHIAFAAPSRAAVERAHVVALASGAKEVRPPGLRPDISATYFGGVFTDLDGHKIEVLTNAA
jgi:catechol 2,3-dioxygenase-like lactoylglutathione lyase family enzyme